MEKIAVLLKAMNLFAHNAHNLAQGPTFGADHPFLGELYEAYDQEYDDVVERMVGKGMAPNLEVVAQKAVKVLLAVAPSNEFSESFNQILQLEQKLVSSIEMYIEESSLNKTCSEGTKQLLGNIADCSEIRQYKIKQRSPKANLVI